MSWVLTIAGICALIILHEFGHFATAKAVGMRVERFSLFFPPTIVKVRRGETEYAIGAIPAGGYVKITGMSPQELDGLEPEVARRAYYNQPPWKRIVVILAGPAMNLLIAFVLFWGVLLSGSPDGAMTLGNLVPEVPTLVSAPTIGAVEKGTPAAGALEPGDRIVAVDGRRGSTQTFRSAIDSHRCLGTLTQGCRAATPARITLARHGRTVTVTVFPRYDPQVKRMLVGFEFSIAPKPFGVVSAAGAAIHEMWSITTQTVTGFVDALTSSKARHQISSIVGITQATQQAIQFGPGRAVVILGFISLVLAVINLFPFLPLDGGHVLWSVAEKVRGRRVSLQAMVRFSSIGIVLLIFLVVSGFSNDINRLTGS